MKIKGRKAKAEVIFDPMLFAASVPARKPPAKDVKDVKAHESDLIEPREYSDCADVGLQAKTPLALFRPCFACAKSEGSQRSC